MREADPSKAEYAGTSEGSVFAEISQTWKYLCQNAQGQREGWHTPRLGVGEISSLANKKLQQQAEVFLTALALSESKQNPQFIKQSVESETKL